MHKTYNTQSDQGVSQKHSPKCHARSIRALAECKSPRACFLVITGGNAEKSLQLEKKARGEMAQRVLLSIAEHRPCFVISIRFGFGLWDCILYFTVSVITF
jgi:hypothetical protein